MITRDEVKVERDCWQQALAEAVTDPQELLSLLKITDQLKSPTKEIFKQFPLRVPRGFIARMQAGNLQDPLLKQVLPISAEGDIVPGYSHDPLAELTTNPASGLLHKYQGRVLLTLTGGCAIHCRYCFRRHFPYQDNTPGRSEWQQTLAYVQADPSIKEVILSGGDPLLVTDLALLSLIDKLKLIPHLQRLRIHSRLPIVLPERITTKLIEILTQHQLQTVLVIHCNHPNEINLPVAKALAQLHQAGITLFNQAVLLKGVNDDATTLCELSEKCFAHKVIPYYLHRLDKIHGAAHFDVPLERALEIMKIMQTKLPGFLLPKFVEEVPGAEAKQLLY